jgi:hypothetical protein
MSAGRVEQCPVQQGKRDKKWHLRFTVSQMHVSQRRRKNRLFRKEAGNLRAAVESTVRQVKHRFPGSKLPVRGLFRVSCMMIGSAMMSNVRRIHGYLEKIELNGAQKAHLFSFPLKLISFIRPWISIFPFSRPFLET